MVAPAPVAQSFSKLRTKQYRFAFVLEQTLGHGAHGRNLERAVAADPDIEPSIVRLGFTSPVGIQKFPPLRTWSWRASSAARDALRKRLRSGPLDAVFIHTQVAALRATKIMRTVPTVISLDATPLLFDREGEAYGHGPDLRLLEALKRNINARAFGEAARIVTWCHWAANSLVSDYGVAKDKIEVIPPGVDLTVFRPTLVPRRPGRVKVLFVGADFERKGGHDLLEAARGLADSVEIDVVTGTETVEIPAGVRATVHHGLRPQSERLVSLYQAADIFVLPSRGDCMPQAVAEAMACGLPVVATAVGAMAEMIRDDVNGLLVRQRDPRALAAAIATLAGAPARRHAMGMMSRTFAKQDQDAARNNARILALLKRLVGSAASDYSADGLNQDS